MFNSFSVVKTSDPCCYTTTKAGELIVADGACPQIRELLTAAEALVIWLDDQEPPLVTVSRALTERRTLGQPVDTLHWVSHGSPGQLHLGTTRIHSSTLLANAQNLASWGLSNLALWSCRAGADHNFIALLEELSGATIWSTASALGRLEDGSSHWTLASDGATAAVVPPALPVAAAQRQAWPAQLNNAPVASGSPSLAAISEDATDPAGDTVANLFGSSFSDADSDTFAGIAITANAADSSTEGAWQYSTDNGSNWTAIATTGLADATALYLDSSTKLRFLPVADFSSTPGALTTRLIDNSADIPAGPSLNPFGLDDVGTYAAPDFADIDGDGLLDAFIGNTNGNTVFFHNTGSSAAPDFSGGSTTNPFGLSDVGNYAAPDFVDIDADGLLDAFIGNRDGSTVFFRNTGTSAVAAFAAGSSDSPFGISDVGYYATPDFVDIDADGLLDAFIGNDNGKTVFFQNTGTSAAPAFAAGSSDTPFGISDVGKFAAPVFADIDGDGLLDAFIGDQYGKTVFFQNTGSSAAPDFTGGSTTNPFGISDVGYFASPVFADLDGDGLLDAFIGNYDGNTVFFQNTGSSAAPAFAAGIASVPARANATTVDVLTNGNSTDISAATLSLTTAVTAVNDAPVASGSPSLAAITEDATDPAGDTVANLFGSSFSDADSDTFVGIAITANAADSSTEGAWQYSTDNGSNWTAIATTGLADATALYLDSSTKLRFLPVADFNGTPGALTTRLIDKSAYIPAAPSLNPFGISNVGSSAAPDFADIDGDGLLDAFIGNYDGDTVYFNNTGTSAAPAFAAGSFDSPFGISDVGSNVAPDFADIDADGLLDAFIGNRDGSTIFFRNTGTSAVAAFAAGSSDSPFGISDVGYYAYATPDFADIDGDGLLDAFIGNSNGNTVFFHNTGSSAAPDFSGGSTTNPFGLNDVVAYAAPDFADIDADGRLDAFIGNTNGNTVFFQNTGTSAAPDFSGGSTTNPFGLADVGRYAAPVFADIDADGRLDAFIGDLNGNTVFFQNTGSSAAPAFAAGFAGVPARANATTIDVLTNGNSTDISAATLSLTTAVTAVNDAPTTTGAGSTLAFSEGDSATVIDNSLTITDADDTNIESATVTISSGFQSAEDVLAFSDTSSITAAWNASTGVLTLSGSDSIANYKAALESVTYNNTSDNPNTANRTVSWVVNDGDTDSSAVTSTISVTAVNDAPVASGSPSLAAISEDATDPAGDTVANLFGSSFSDADSDTFVGIAITANAADSSTEGAWQYSTDNGSNWTAIATTGLADATALYLYSSTKLRFLPVADFNGTPGALTTRLIDNSADIPAGPSLNPFGLDDVGISAAPDFADIDGDGRLDAFIGNNYGNTVFFRNTGSSAAPDFSGGSTTNPFGLVDVGSYATPDFVDIDADGRLDAFIGDYYGNTVFFQNTGTSAAPDFSGGSTTNPFGISDVGYYATPDFVDIDADGLLDAFIGDLNGNTVFFQNTGTSAAPDFSGGSTTNPFGLNAVGMNASPVFADLDGDGLLDAFIGNRNGNTVFFQNTGSSAAPDFSGGSTTNPFGISNVGIYAAPDFADIDGDGRLDAFIGNRNGNTVFFQNTGSSAAPAFAAGIASVPARANATTIDVLTNGNSTDISAATLSLTTAVTAVNDAPTTTGAGSTLAFSEGDSATVIDNSLTITDADDTNIESATVTISSGFQSAEDVLAFSDTSSITAAWNASTGVLTLSGSDSIANYKAALESVTYNNTSDNPNTANRTVSWVVDDGDTDSSAVTSTISVTAVNDAPTTTGASSTLAFSEGDSATVIDNSLTITDADDTNIESATVTISSGFQSAEDVLAFSDTSSITAAWNASTGVLTLSGSDSIANYKAALESVTYNNTSDNPNTANRTVSWVVNDGDTDSSAVTSTISVTAVNDAPVASGSPSLATITEDATDPAGDTVANLFGSSFFDADSDTFVGIAITANAADSSTEGAWQYSTNNGSNWTAIATTGLADATALYLDSSTKLRFLPVADFSSTPGALTTRLIDNSASIPAAPSINPFGLVDVGGLATPDFVDIDADGRLDAFIGNNYGKTVFFRNTGSSAAPDFSGGSTTNPFGISDVGSAAAPVFADIDADGLLDAFIGNYDGDTVYFNNTGTAAAPDFSGGSTTNPFGISDVGKFAAPVFADIDGDGLLDAFIGDQYGKTVFFQNTGSSAAPDFSGGSTTNPFGLSDVGNYAAPDFADLDGDGLLDAFIGNYDGNTVFFQNTGTSAVPDFSGGSTTNPFGISNVGIYAAPDFADIDGDGRLDAFIGNRNGNTVFFQNTGSSAAPAFAAGIASVPARANATTIDVLTNGNSTDISAATLSLTTAVTAVNDAPTTTGAGSTLVFSEGDGATVIDSSLTITDADDTNIESATVTISSGFQSAEDVLAFTDSNGITGSWNASTGVLTLSGTSSKNNYQAALESVTYNNTSDTPNTANRTVSWVVDDGDTDSSAVTSTISVTVVNDAPIASGSPSLATISEDATDPAGDTVANLFGSSFSDADSDTFVGIAITANAADSSTEGAWQYSTDNGSNWTAIATSGLSDSSALYLSSTTKLRFLPAADFSGTPGALTTRLIDNSADIPAAPSLNPFGISNVGYHAAPVFVDIDGDGRLDAFIGNDDGKTVFFRNTGTSAAPDFSGGSTTNPFGISNVGGRAFPDFVDIDGDGRLDAFIGDLNGNTVFFHNTGSSAVPDFSGGSTTNPFGISDVGYYAAPDFVDIDADGLLDAFIGNNDGNTVFFHNTGSSAAPDFSGVSTTNPFGISDVDFNADPDFVDIDADGLLDAFIGNFIGNTVFFRNTGSSAAPDFSGGSTTNPFSLANVGYLAAPDFVDINADGLLDAFIGNNTGNTVFFQNTGSSAAPAFAAGFSGIPARANASTVDVSTNGNSTDISAAALSLTTAVTAVNDAPVASGSPSLAAISEDSTDPAGDTVANLFGSSFSDADSDTFVGIDGDTLQGVAITANAATASQGVWQYSTDSGSNWTAIATSGLSDSAALYLDSSTKLRFLPVADFNGTPGALTTRLIDSSASIPAAPSLNPFGISNVGYHAAPVFVDIDGDGRLDAFIGNDDGKTVFFRNTGTSAAPDFSGGSTTNPFGLVDVGYRAAPDFVDIDGDGLLDAFIGNSDGTTVFFRNTGSSAVPDFSGGSTTNPFGISNVGIYAAPDFADIDADGRLDAFIGNYDGNTVFFRNTGSSAAPDFSGGSTTNPFGISDVGTYAAPDFADIDADGLLDAFIGNSDGTTVFFHNTGSSAAPDFSGGSTTNPFGLANVGYFASPVFADIDADGRLDAFIGNYEGNTIYFENNTSIIVPGGTIDVSTNGDSSAFSADEVTLSTAVNAENDAPSGSVTISGTATQGEVLTAANTLADADGLGSISYQWKRAGVAITGATSFNYQLVQADVGSAISVTASYTDALGAAESVSSTATSAVANINDAPSGSVTISGTETQGEVLTAANTLADVDGLGSISYQWKRAGVAITGATSFNYQLVQADVGSAISVTASYTDALGAAESVSSTATSAVANVNDATSGSVTISGTATQGEVLIAENTLADVDGFGSISYQWKRAGVAITGATSFNYQLVQADVGSAISVTASYTDALGAAESVSSTATSAVANVNDAPSGSVTISGTAMQGEVLTAANTLADVDGLGSISYQWKRAGVAITGATSFNYQLVQADVGSAISVTASYTDALGAAESVMSTATSAVANVNDAPSGSVTISGTAMQGEVLTAANTLADVDGLGSISYQWKRAGVAITGATSFNYQLVQADVGSAISVTASYTDALGAAESVMSTATSAVVDATAPAAPSAVDLVAASDSGMSEVDNLTDNTSTIFTGSAEANSSVELFANSLSLGSTTANALGEWSFRIPSVSPLTDGSYAITATATDRAGNTSAVSAALNLSIDASGPTFISTGTAAFTDESTNIDQLIYTAIATDLSTITYSLKTNNSDDADLFSIDSITGEVRLTNSPDDGTQNSYHFAVTATDQAGNSSVHQVHTADSINRLYNSVTGQHLLSNNRSEINLLTNAGWTDEGSVGCAPADATADVFRFFVTSQSRHFYTALEYERDLIINNQQFTESGWQYEGKAFSAHSTSDHPDDVVAVMRYFNQETGLHVYTNSAYEQSLLDQESNWFNEGIAWYSDRLPTSNDLA